MNAIATLLHAGGTDGGDIRFAAMAAILGKSAERLAPTLPFIVIVAGPYDEANLKPIKDIVPGAIILRKSIFQAKGGGKYWRPNLSKIHVWNLVEYSRVLFLDADCWLKADPKHCFGEGVGSGVAGELVCCPGPEAPMNGARLLIQPSRDVFYDLLSFADEYSFSVSRGWADYGPFIWPVYPGSPAPGEKHDWNFNAAENDQGLFWYYFGLLKKRMSYVNCHLLVDAADHIGRGERKFSQLPPTYKALVDELNLEHFFEA